VTQPGPGGKDCIGVSTARPDSTPATIDTSGVWTAPADSSRPGSGAIDPDRLDDGDAAVPRTYNPFDRSPAINPAPTR
jgi:hypothetical protein